MLLDWVHPDVLIRRFVFAPRATTQLAMDRLYIAEADIYLAFRVQVRRDPAPTTVLLLLLAHLETAGSH